MHISGIEPSSVIIKPKMNLPVPNIINLETTTLVPMHQKNFSSFHQSKVQIQRQKMTGIYLQRMEAPGRQWNLIFTIELIAVTL